MWKKRMITLLTIFLCSMVYSQDTTKRVKPGVNIFTVEIGKSPMIGNFVFDRWFRNGRNGMRAFVGWHLPKYRPVFTIGAGIYHLLSAGKNHFELGADLGYINIGDVVDSSHHRKRFQPDFKTSSYIVSLNAGYRLKAKRHLFRLGAAPVFVDNRLLPGGYFSVGVRL